MTRRDRAGITICRGEICLEQLEERIVLDGAAGAEETNPHVVGITPGEGIFDGDWHWVEGDHFLYWGDKGWWYDYDHMRWGYAFDFTSGYWWENSDAGWHVLWGAPWDYEHQAQQGILVFDNDVHLINNKWMWYWQGWTSWYWDGAERFRFDHFGGPDGIGQWYFLDFDMPSPQWQYYEQEVPLGHMFHLPDGAGGFQESTVHSSMMLFDGMWYPLPGGHGNDWYIQMPGRGTDGHDIAYFFCDGSLDYAYDFGKTGEAAWIDYGGFNADGSGGYVGESTFLFREASGNDETFDIINASKNDPGLKVEFDYVNYDPATFGQYLRLAMVGDDSQGEERWLETNTINLTHWYENNGTDPSVETLNDWLHDIWMAHTYQYFDTIMIDDAGSGSSATIGTDSITAANVNSFADHFKEIGGYMTAAWPNPAWLQFLAPNLASGDDGKDILNAIHGYINEYVPWSTAEVWGNTDDPYMNDNANDHDCPASWDLDWGTNSETALAKEHILYFVLTHQSTGEFFYSDVWGDGSLYPYESWHFTGDEYLYNQWRFTYTDEDEFHGEMNSLVYHADGTGWIRDPVDGPGAWDPLGTWFDDTDEDGKHKFIESGKVWWDPTGGDTKHVFHYFDGDRSVNYRWDPVHQQWERYGVWFQEETGDFTNLDGTNYGWELHLYDTGEWRTYHWTSAIGTANPSDYWRNNSYSDAGHQYFFTDASGDVEWWDFVSGGGAWVEWETWIDYDGERGYHTFDASGLDHSWSNGKWGFTIFNDADNFSGAAVKDHDTENYYYYDSHEHTDWRRFRFSYNEGGWYYYHDFDYTYMDKSDPASGFSKLRMDNISGNKTYQDDQIVGWSEYEEWFNHGGDQVWVTWNWTYVDPEGAGKKWVAYQQSNDVHYFKDPTDGSLVDSKPWEWRDAEHNRWEVWESESHTIGGSTFSEVYHTYDSGEWRTYYSDASHQNDYWRDNEHGDSSHHYYFWNDSGTLKWYDNVDTSYNDWELWQTWFDDPNYGSDYFYNTFGVSYRDRDGSYSGSSDDDCKQLHSDGRWQVHDGGWKDMFEWSGEYYYHWDWKYHDYDGDENLNDDGREGLWTADEQWYASGWKDMDTWHGDKLYDWNYTYQDPDGAPLNKWLRQSHTSGDWTVKDRDDGNTWKPYQSWQYEATGFDGSPAHVYYEYDKAYYDIDGSPYSKFQYYRDLDTGDWYEWDGDSWETYNP